MGWTPTLAAPVAPLPAVPMASLPTEPPTGASGGICLLEHIGDVYTLGIAGREGWRAYRMVEGGLRVVPGTRYPGQVIVYGTRTAKEAAGLSPFLTHARATHPTLAPLLKPGAAAAAQFGSRFTWAGVGLVVVQDV
ncbi:MAG: hypothetical protein RMM10_13500, partial [Anaerolineae bacterium]|uniref:hypothetical protein n=1 Tax=Thermoflexus sp. TaxID=1969742 RepID=UPI0025F35556